MEEKVIGIIGGSGLYQMPELERIESRRLSTPFGEPSAEYISGWIGDTRVVFLSRHGPGHRFLPSEINYRANIYGFRMLGVRHVVSISAVGSLREEIHPGDLVLADQFIDRTRLRPHTFYGNGAVIHVQFGDPVCNRLKNFLAESIQALGRACHSRGTYVAIEGPAFSTRAESNLYRSWGADVIGMTALPEARLAREAEICYALLALCTDYDCWHEAEEEVSVETVLRVLNQNVATARKIIGELARRFKPDGGCRCQHALDNTLLTDPAAVPEDTRLRIGLLAGRLFGR